MGSTPNKTEYRSQKERWVYRSEIDRSLLLVSLIFSILGIVTGGADAAILHVPGQYKTISEAVEKALPGDTVLVMEGEYRENILITKAITVKADKGPDRTVVNASDISEPVFKVRDVDRVVISGFTAKGSRIAGIYLYNANSGMILDNKALENRNGIYLYSSNNNTLMNNVASSNEQSGIYLELSNNNTIRGNVADYNKEKGIFLNSSNSNSLLFNSASRNEWNGLILWSSMNNIVQGNKVLRNTYSIILSNSEGNRLSDNTTWTNFNLIVPIILVYIGVLFYWIQRRIFRLFYKEEKDIQANL